VTIIRRNNGEIDWRYISRSARYNIGGLPFSLDEIKHGILRGNKSSPWFVDCRFMDDDPRLKFVLFQHHLQLEEQQQVQQQQQQQQEEEGQTEKTDLLVPLADSSGSELPKEDIGSSCSDNNNGEEQQQQQQQEESKKSGEQENNEGNNEKKGVKEVKGDKRVMFALSNHMMYSPNLRVYEPDKVEEQLNLSAEEYCSSMVHIESVTTPTSGGGGVGVVEHKRIILPEQFLWYGEDFGAVDSDSILRYCVLPFLTGNKQKLLAAILDDKAYTYEINYVNVWSLTPKCLIGQS